MSQRLKKSYKFKKIRVLKFFTNYKIFKKNIFKKISFHFFKMRNFFEKI